MRILLSLITLLFLTTSAHAKVNCAKNPLFCTMRSLNPSIDPKWGMQLSNYIHKYSKRYRVDPYISLAIAMQESSLVDRNRHQSVLIKDEAGNYVKIEGISDIGVWQLHVNTVENYNFDAKRVMTDLKYATKCHFIILSKKMRKCKRLGKDSWTCYHSSTKHHRLNYKARVMKYYKGNKYASEAMDDRSSSLVESGIKLPFIGNQKPGFYPVPQAIGYPAK